MSIERMLSLALWESETVSTCPATVGVKTDSLLFLLPPIRQHYSFPAHVTFRMTY